MEAISESPESEETEGNEKIQEGPVLSSASSGECMQRPRVRSAVTKAIDACSTRDNNEEETPNATPRKKRKNHVEAVKSFGHKVRNSLLASRWVMMMSNQIWKQSLVQNRCEIVLSFPSTAKEATVKWFEESLSLHVPQLFVEVKFHPHTRNFCFYLNTTSDEFLKGAEELCLRKPLKVDVSSSCVLREFQWEERQLYQGVEDVHTFLCSRERQDIVLHFLQQLKSDSRQKLFGIAFLEGQPIVPKCLAEGVISQVFPLHEVDKLTKLRRTWVQAFLKIQPLSDISQYFGVKIALYFAWLGHYTHALLLPAALGFFLWLFCYGGNQMVEDSAFVAFALFNVIWTTLYLESWKRSCSELAFKWGTLDTKSNMLEEPRPLFTGPLAVSPVTGKMEPTYPTWKRNLFRYFVSLPIISCCLAVATLAMLSILELQEWWDGRTDCSYCAWLAIWPKILLAVVITILDAIYSKIAYWLNDMENHKLERKYQNNLIFKLFLVGSLFYGYLSEALLLVGYLALVTFQFVNSFLSLFYIAFYLQDMEQLKEQLAALLITRQIMGNIKESVLPFCFETFELSRLRVLSSAPCQTSSQSWSPPDSNEESLNQAQVESSLYTYCGTFEEYLEMVIQFGYVVLFSSAFPLAAFFSLLNNLLEIRSDAFKLCVIFQRPFGQQVDTIGSWQGVLEVVGMLAVMVNCALVGVSGHLKRLFPSLAPYQVFWLIVFLEHVILFGKFVLAQAIPDVPQWVATEMAKEEFLRREAAMLIQRSNLKEQERKHSLERQNSYPI